MSFYLYNILTLLIQLIQLSLNKLIEQLLCGYVFYLAFVKNYCKIIQLWCIIKFLEVIKFIFVRLYERTSNWDSDRIAKIDYIIIITAIAELIYFSSIPTKVSINEFIDIAKDFSTPSSGKFVNGVLDNMVKDLIEQGLIVKSGRGLIT